MAIPGHASQDSGGNWSISGSGSDIWGTADSFQFLHTTSDAASFLDVWVSALQNTNTYAKAGVMVRSSMSASASTAIFDVRPDGSLEFMVRASDGGQMQFIRGLNQYGLPVNLRLSWANGTVTAFVRSSQMDPFFQLASAPLTLPSSTEAGIAVTSHDQSQLAEAQTFGSPILTRQTSGGWNSADIGAVGVAGNASESNGVWTISGAGGDIWGTADAFHFVSVGANVNLGTIRVRVDDMQNTNAFAKTGIMLRAGLAADDPAVILDVTPGGGIEFMARQTKGGEMQFAGGITVSGFPVWLALSNAAAGDHIDLVASVSQDGVHWTNTFAPSRTLPPVPLYYAGAVVTSHDTSRLNTAHVRGLSVLGANIGVAEIGNTGIMGNAALDAGAPNSPLRIEGAGADIWGAADSFEFVYGGIGSGSIVFGPRLVSLSATNAFAKAGVMIRDGLQPNAPSVVLDVKPGGGVEFMARMCAGCATSFIAGGQVTLPATLTLTRSGSTISASVSSGGATTAIGSVDVPMPNALIGYAVTSHDTSQLATAVFDFPH